MISISDKLLKLMISIENKLLINRLSMIIGCNKIVLVLNLSLSPAGTAFVVTKTCSPLKARPYQKIEEVFADVYVWRAPASYISASSYVQPKTLSKYSLRLDI